MASRQSGKRKLAAAEDRTEEANTKRAREDSSTIHPQNPLLACNHCKNCLKIFFLTMEHPVDRQHVTSK